MVKYSSQLEAAEAIKGMGLTKKEVKNRGLRIYPVKPFKGLKITMYVISDQHSWVTA